MGFEVFAGEGGALGDQVGGRTFEGDPATIMAGARAEVDDVAGSFGQVADLRRLVYGGVGDIPRATNPYVYVATTPAFISRGTMF
jgi:hypothetical protein